MEHVLVETNWVVAVVTPTVSRRSDALELLEKARRRDVTLHVPAICFLEAKKVVQVRRVRVDFDAVRSFVRDRRAAGDIAEPAVTATFDVLSRFQQHLEQERMLAAERIAELSADPSIDVFALDETMLTRAIELASQTSLVLEPFDLSILAAVLTRAAALHAEGHAVSFCTLDGDLQPWDRLSQRRGDMADLFDHAGVWVFGDFLMQTPPRPQRAG